MGKKTLKIIISVLIAAVLFVGCGSKKYGPISGYTTPESAVVSNGGFVANYGEYTYFINGRDYNYSNNNLGTPVKSALYRVKTSSIGKEDAVYDRVVPKLFVAGTYDAGFYISGDYVYYATPNTLKNKQGNVEYTYLDFNRTKLDGTETTKLLPKARNYFSNSSMPYRFMEIDGTLYIVYVNEGKLYSYNTQSGALKVLVEEHTSYIFSKDLSDNNIYYTAAVKTDDLELALPYNTVYQIQADGENAKMILNGVGELKEGATSTIGPWNRNFTLLQASSDYLYFTAKGNESSAKDAAYILDLNALDIAAETEYDSAIENFNLAAEYKSTNLANFTAGSFFKGDKYVFYVDSAQGIMRDNLVLGKSGQEGALAINKEALSATLMFIDGEYLYYNMASSEGATELYRMKYGGTRDNYNYNHGDYSKEYGGVKIGDVNLSSGWYAPEIIGDNVFYLSADSLSFGYVYVYDLADIDNEESKSVFIGERNKTDEEAYQEELKRLEEEEENN